jgi:hypothetical protein
MTVSTDKARVAAYVPIELKEAAEELAKSQKRSLSNLIEILLDRAVRENTDCQVKSDRTKIE